ncbi:carboxymuconolactone decarboxylase family protein [Nocardia aobensis]|uniref:Carboxymuconolactone decarboxylase family protein n=1 Tax=Nocardia aobensis TaxID=257277 RepID=A0ABW6P1B2_9NOCA
MTTTSPPRLAPLPADQWDERARSMLRGHVRLADRYLSGRPDAPPMPNVLGILGHHTELAAAWLAYNGVLLDQPALDARYRELLILRIARCTGSVYEWAQHVRIGAEYGIDDAQVAAVAHGPADPLWSPVERLLLSAADELLDRHRVTDDTWSGLAAHFDTRQLLEILFVAGSYLCLALVFNSVDLQLDPGMDRAAPTPPQKEERP